EAARRTLERLGSHEAVARLLELRDNNLTDCVELISGMLARRDQWIRAFPLAGEMSEEDWEQARSHLERPFRAEIKRVHGEVHRLLMAHPTLSAELVDLARYACGNGNRHLAALEVMRELPRPELMGTEQWRCLAHFVLTSDEWRKPGGLNITSGFPKEG